MKIKRMIFILACVLCGGVFLYTKYIDAPTQVVCKSDFTKEELLADYDYVWDVLESDYIYLDILEKNHGIDIEGLKT